MTMTIIYNDGNNPVAIILSDTIPAQTKGFKGELPALETNLVTSSLAVAMVLCRDEERTMEFFL